MKLYELQSEEIALYDEFYSLFDQDTGELLEGKEEEMEALQAKIVENKESGKRYLDFYLKQYNQSKADEAQISAEIERLSKLNERQAKATEKLKGSVENIVKAIFNNKYENEINVVSFRKSSGLIIDKEDEVEEKFKKTKEVVSIDKTAITNAIKAGENIAYAHIEERENLQIR